MGIGGEATATINATPMAVYGLVSDVTRTHEWSPESVTVEWVDGASIALPGARFMGTSQVNGEPRFWECVVEAADPGHAFAFRTDGGTRWGYRLQGASDGPTAVIYWYEDSIDDRFHRIRRSRAATMRYSLDRIQAILEVF